MPQVIIHTSLAMIFLWLAGVTHTQRNRFGREIGAPLMSVCQGMWLFTFASLVQVSFAMFSVSELIESLLGVVTFACICAGLAMVLRGMSQWKTLNFDSTTKDSSDKASAPQVEEIHPSVRAPKSTTVSVERTNVAALHLSSLLESLRSSDIVSLMAPEMVFNGLRTAMGQAFDVSFVMLVQKLPDLNQTLIFSALGARGNVSRAFHSSSKFIEVPLRSRRDDCIHEMNETPRFDSRIGWEYLSRSSSKKALVIRNFASQNDTEQCLVIGWNSRAVNLKEMRRAVELVMHDLRLILDEQTKRQSDLTSTVDAYLSQTADRITYSRSKAPLLGNKKNIGVEELAVSHE